MNLRSMLTGFAAAAAMGLSALSATAADPIKIGEINHYKRMAAFAEPYKKGIELGLAEINAGEALRAAHAGDDAQIDLGLAELGRIGRDDEIADHRQLAPAA